MFSIGFLIMCFFQPLPTFNRKPTLSYSLCLYKSVKNINHHTINNMEHETSIDPRDPLKL
jgi:hypothetical protein